VARTIELTRTIAAPPEAVFRALTDADELTKWFATSADSDPRTGGAFDYRFEFAEDESRNHSYGGVYGEVVANERVSYPWRSRLGDTRVDVTLRPSGESTELRLVHSGWGESSEWRESLRMHEEGWRFFLDNLKSWLESGEDRRASAMGMKTAAATRA
jgi:uncharacterized protein YndB with AHSA1/START domain